MIIYCLQDRQNDYKRDPYNNTGSKNPVLGSSGTSRLKKGHISFNHDTAEKTLYLPVNNIQSLI